jgi:hypothetical protein
MVSPYQVRLAVVLVPVLARLIGAENEASELVANDGVA